MFSLLSGFWKWLTHKVELRFLILGLDNAGKTTTLEQVKRIYQSRTPRTSVDQIVPTVGLNLCHVNFDRSTSGVFWDLGGQLMLRGIWEKHYRDCDAIVFVIDSTDAARFDEVKATFVSVMRHPILFAREVPVLFLINKQDDEDHAVCIYSLSEYLGVKRSSSSSSGAADAVFIPYPSSCRYREFHPTAGDAQQLSSAEQSSSAAAPSASALSVVCVSGSSAVKNVNIKAAIEVLVCETKRRRELKREWREQPADKGSFLEV